MIITLESVRVYASADIDILSLLLSLFYNLLSKYCFKSRIKTLEQCS